MTLVKPLVHTHLIVVAELLVLPPSQSTYKTIFVPKGQNRKALDFPGLQDYRSVKRNTMARGRGVERQALERLKK